MSNQLSERTTQRLLFSAPTAADIPLIVRYAAAEEISRYTLNIPHPYQEKDAVFWLHKVNEGLADGSQFTYALRDKKTGDFQGGIGLHLNRKYQSAEVGYWLAVPFWGQGLMTEALSEMLRFGFLDLGLRRIYAHHMSENVGSGKVMERNNMVKEGVLRQHLLNDGKVQDLVAYGILREEFMATLQDV